MLVLTRKLDEQIMIGDDIKVTLLRVRGNTVRIGIEAPRDVRVVRGELARGEGARDGRSPAGPETTRPVGSEKSADKRAAGSGRAANANSVAANSSVAADFDRADLTDPASGDPQEQVFAHPQPPRGTRSRLMSMRAGSAMRVDSSTRTGSSSRSGGARTKVFEGKVARGGERVELRPVGSDPTSRVPADSSRSATPLGRFVPAT